MAASSGRWRRRLRRAMWRRRGSGREPWLLLPPVGNEINSEVRSCVDQVKRLSGAAGVEDSQAACADRVHQAGGEIEIDVARGSLRGDIDRIDAARAGAGDQQLAS